MLKLQLPAIELFDERTNEFVYGDAFEVELEHSLVSLSKWEEKYNKPFLSEADKTTEEVLYYIRCMALRDLSDYEVTLLGRYRAKEIENYIKAPMTATWFSKEEGAGHRHSGEAVTAELIYYWMIALNVPFECQHWHLNKLLTLIQVCNLKNKPPKKMSRGSILKNNAALNKARRAKLHSKG